MKIIYILLAVAPIMLFSQRNYHQIETKFTDPNEFLYKPDFNKVSSTIKALDARVDANMENVAVYLNMIVDYNNERKAQKKDFTKEETDYIINNFNWALENYRNPRIMLSSDNARQIITQLKKVFYDMQEFKCSENCYNMNLNY